MQLNGHEKSKFVIEAQVKDLWRKSFGDRSLEALFYGNKPKKVLPLYKDKQRLNTNRHHSSSNFSFIKAFS